MIRNPISELDKLVSSKNINLYRSHVPIIYTVKCWSLDNRACFFRKDTVVVLNTVFTAGVRTMFSLLSIFLQTWHPFKRNFLDITYHTVTWLSLSGHVYIFKHVQ